MLRLPLVRLATFGLVVASCGHKPPPVEPVPLDRQAERAADLKAGLLTQNLFGGWVATRALDGTAVGLGDSLLWSGLTLGILGCDEGRPIFDALKASQDIRGGYFVRYEPLGDSYRGNEVSRDGVTGLVFGLIRRFKVCPQDREEIAVRWGRYRDLVRGAISLYPGNIRAIQTPGFGALMEAADHALLGRPEPAAVKVVAWEFQTLTNARDVMDRKSPCYPVHLSTIQGYLMSEFVSQSYKEEFCSVTSQSGLMLTSWYCRATAEVVELWLEHYQTNQIEYAHQRCSWESEYFPLGGKATALDFLVLYSLAKGGD